MRKLYFACIIAVAPLVSCGNEPDQVAATLSGFPNTVTELSEFKERAVREFEAGLAAYKGQPKGQLNFENAVMGWSRLLERLAAQQLILAFTFMRTKNPLVLLESGKQVRVLQEALEKGCQDRGALAVFMEYAEKVVDSPHLLTAAEKYILSLILQTVHTGKVDNGSLKSKAALLQEILADQQSLPFTYAQGEGEEKTLPKDGKVVVLNWNVCFFDHAISMIFGGVLPWQQRVDGVVDLLKRSHPDLICLQEMFSSEAAVSLYEKLKSEYPHFYINIGPKPFGFDLNSIGIPSGLFVASRYPLEKVGFTPYKPGETPLNRGYGFFAMDLKDRDKAFGQVITTHFQPGDGRQDLAYRQMQVKAILKHLEGSRYPSFLCGDLNLERSSDEYKQLEHHFFSSPSELSWTCCELRDYWWKAGQNVARFKALGVQLEWIDYFLGFRSHNIHPAIKTRVISVNHLDDPRTSLSDHQPLETVVFFR